MKPEPPKCPYCGKRMQMGWIWPNDKKRRRFTVGCGTYQHLHGYFESKTRAAALRAAGRRK